MPSESGMNAGVSRIRRFWRRLSIRRRGSKPFDTVIFVPDHPTQDYELGVTLLHSQSEHIEFAVSAPSDLQSGRADSLDSLADISPLTLMPSEPVGVPRLPSGRHAFSLTRDTPVIDDEQELVPLLSIQEQDPAPDYTLVEDAQNNPTSPGSSQHVSRSNDLLYMGDNNFFAAVGPARLMTDAALRSAGRITPSSASPPIVPITRSFSKLQRMRIAPRPPAWSLPCVPAPPEPEPVIAPSDEKVRSRTSSSARCTPPFVPARHEKVCRCGDAACLASSSTTPSPPGKEGKGPEKRGWVLFKRPRLSGKKDKGKQSVCDEMPVPSVQETEADIRGVQSKLRELLGRERVLHRGEEGSALEPLWLPVAAVEEDRDEWIEDVSQVQGSDEDGRTMRMDSGYSEGKGEK